MFFLRCAFFLSLVYSSMSWTNTAFDPRKAVPTQAMQAGRTVAASVVDRAIAGATDFCARHATECLTQAAELTSLVAATDPSNIRAEDAQPDSVPLPVPDPRRRTQDAKLAPTP